MTSPNEGPVDKQVIYLPMALRKRTGEIKKIQKPREVTLHGIQKRRWAEIEDQERKSLLVPKISIHSCLGRLYSRKEKKKKRKRNEKEILSILRFRNMKKFPVSSDWLRIPCRAALMKIKYI